MTVSSAPLSDEAIHCRDLVRRVNPDRALLAELAPPRLRPHLWAIAAFDWEVGRIPDLVSEPMLGAIRRQWWRDAWAEIAEGRPRRHPVVEALAAAHQAAALPLAAVDAYLEAREAEQEGPPTDMAQMKERAAGIGGRIAALEGALLGRDLTGAGAAWALIGEVRALPQRLQHGRHGLPEDRVAALPEALSSLDPDNLDRTFIQLVQEITAAAEAAARAETGGMPLAHGYRRLTLHYAAKLRQAGWNPFAVSVNAHTFGRVWSVAMAKLGL